ncbi:MAG: hypothetical protein KatS3mg076_1506 [Candidatus Binatia bacterium]|nr:MAG: hypothetical protein KatS3mg076_1506 [Candidatus Binatia bacterium]
MLAFCLPLAGLFLLGCGDSDSQGTFLPWEELRNPVLALPDRSLKDVAVAYEPSSGWFYVFTSTRFEPTDPEAGTKEKSFFRTRDFLEFEAFSDPDLNGPGYGPGSPDLVRVGDLWYMTFQRSTANVPFLGAATLWVSTSEDLREWSPPRELAPELLDPTLRNIDGALAEEGGYFYLGWKKVQSFVVTRSVDPVLDGRWLPERPAVAGEEGEFAENFQFIEIDGTWRLLATGRDPGPYRCEEPAYAIYTCDHEPFLYRMEGDGTELEHWTRWVEKTHLEVPFEEWNTVMHANSAYLADWRRYDGHFYLFYAGSSDGKSFELRGHGKIGMARSRDLEHWEVPGVKKPADEAPS